MDEVRRPLGIEAGTALIRRLYPDGKQPVTAPPSFVALGPDDPGTEDCSGGGRFNQPVLIQLYCATQGASIVYSIDEEPDKGWRLYTQPLRLKAGVTNLRARAHRIGYAPSLPRQGVFNITPENSPS